MDQMLNEVDEVKYVIKVNGVVVSTAYPSKQLAENAVINLPEDQQGIAEIAPVTAAGQEVLLG